MKNRNGSLRMLAIDIDYRDAICSLSEQIKSCKLCNGRGMINYNESHYIRCENCFVNITLINRSLEKLSLGIPYSED